MALSMEELKKGYLERNSEVAADTLAEERGFTIPERRKRKQEFLQKSSIIQRSYFVLLRDLVARLKLVFFKYYVVKLSVWRSRAESAARNCDGRTPGPRPPELLQPRRGKASLGALLTTRNWLICLRSIGNRWVITMINVHDSALD